jgi:predicted transposase YbfD/YdcC
MTAGSDSLWAIGQWAQTARTSTLKKIGATSRPSESAIRRLLQRLDPDLFDVLTGTWTWLKADPVAGRTVISFDGKAVRGARTTTTKAPHLLSGMLHGPDVIIAQKQVAAKTNEIPALRDLIKLLVISGCVIIADALHSHAKTASAILDQQGHYLFTVKANKKALRNACAALPWAKVPERRFKDTSHGRHVLRSIRVVAAPEWIKFPGLAQVARVVRTRTDKKGRKTTETVHLVCSLPAHQASPEDIAEWIRHHWAIEDRIHHVRDVTFHEDARKVRTGHAPRVLASLANLTIAVLRSGGADNIAAARRHCSWDYQHLQKVLLTS